jgi:hypothetical protein
LSKGKGLSEEAVRKKKTANDDDAVDGEKFDYVDHGYFVVAPHISFLLFLLCALLRFHPPVRLKQVMTIRLFFCFINEIERHFAQETQLNLLKRREMTSRRFVSVCV